MLIKCSRYSVRFIFLGKYEKSQIIVYRIINIDQVNSADFESSRTIQQIFKYLFRNDSVIQIFCYRQI
jgi:hypothetical protein